MISPTADLKGEVLKKTGKIFVISAPSGTGKTTLCNKILGDFPDIRFSISCTTRPKRSGELDGRDYHFIDKKKFELMAKQGDFAEWAEVHGEFYGTRTSDIEKAEKEGTDIILDIDWQGARQIKEKLGRGVFIFILPPDISELERRLKKRGKDSDEVIRKRLENAREELTHVSWYDHNIINDDIGKATEALKAIINAEKRRTHPLKS